MKRICLTSCVLFALGAASLSGCHETAVPSASPPLTMEGAPYALRVGSIHFAKEYRSYRLDLASTQICDIPPAQAVQQWADEKLVAAGDRGTLEVVVKDVHVDARHLPKQKTGIEGFFTNEQSEEYAGSIAVELDLYDGVHTMPAATVSASARSSRTVLENATLNERKDACFRMTKELMHLLATELDQNIHKHFANYLVAPGI